MLSKAALWQGSSLSDFKIGMHKNGHMHMTSATPRTRPDLGESIDCHILFSPIFRKSVPWPEVQVKQV